MNSTLQKTLVLVSSTLALAATACGIYYAIHSPLFVVRVVEFADQPEGVESSPVDSSALFTLAAVPVGEVSLFDLDLKSIENRLLKNIWIREVRLQKRFPQTLSISVTFRNPRALLQSESGAIVYVDHDGKIFGDLNLNQSPDLPILSGFDKSGPHLDMQIEAALHLLDVWGKSEVAPLSQISSISWDAERGYRLLVTYSFKDGIHHSHTMLDLGQDIDAALEAQMARLSRVFRYLASNSVPAHQIWADAGKKIVVKTAHGS